MENNFVGNFYASSLRKPKKPLFALSYCTRRILFNVYVALIHVVSLVVNVLQTTKAKSKTIIYLQLQNQTFLSVDLLTKRNDWKHTTKQQHQQQHITASKQKQQYVYLSILSLEIID